MNRCFIVLLIFIFPIIITAAPAASNLNDEVQIVYLKSNLNKNDGGYDFAYDLSDGSSQQQTGTLKTVNNVQVIVIEGSYSYNTPDGQRVVYNYVADENGYVATPVKEQAIVGFLSPKVIASIVG